MNAIYILCTPAVHEAALACGIYAPESLAFEGFIHASPAEQLSRVANKYYGQAPVLHVLSINPNQVNAEIRWETIANGDIYPHIYGPLNMDAVVNVTSVTPNPDTGCFDIRL